MNVNNVGFIHAASVMQQLHDILSVCLFSLLLVYGCQRVIFL